MCVWQGEGWVDTSNKARGVGALEEAKAGPFLLPPVGSRGKVCDEQQQLYLGAGEDNRGAVPLMCPEVAIWGPHLLRPPHSPPLSAKDAHLEKLCELVSEASTGAEREAELTVSREEA